MRPSAASDAVVAALGASPWWCIRTALTWTAFTAKLLMAGVMNIRVMALTTAAITAERLAPRPEIAARASGVFTIVLGSLLSIGVMTL